jgi:nitrogen fixation protein FixH
MKPTTPSNHAWWPTGILVAFGLFIAGLSVLIAVAVSTKSELVVPDYYEQELRYQTHLDRAKRAEAFGSDVAILHDPATRSLCLRLPKAHVQPSLTGELHLYRPSAAGLDRHIQLQLDADGVQRIDVGALAPGLWKARLNWSMAGTEFYVERRLVLHDSKP